MSNSERRLQLHERVLLSLNRILGKDLVRHVQCESNERHVSLAGTVATRDDMFLCLAVARTTPGVDSFENKVLSLNR